MPVNYTALWGATGSAYLPGTPTVPIANISQWDITLSQAQYEAAVLGVYWQIRVNGLHDWQGKLTGQYAVPSDQTGQQVIKNALFNGLTVVLVLQTSALAGGGSYEGTANISEMTTSAAFNALVPISFSFMGNGTLQPLDF